MNTIRTNLKAIKITTGGMISMFSVRNYSLILINCHWKLHMSHMTWYHEHSNKSMRRVTRKHTAYILIIPRRKFDFSWNFVRLWNSEFFAISSTKPNLKRLRPDTHNTSIGGVDLHNVRERLSGLMNPLDANNTLRSWWQTQMFQQVFFILEVVVRN